MADSQRSVAGCVVVVTGAAGGIGRALAHRFARAGSKVAVLDVDAGGAELVAADLRSGGADAIALACDVTSEEACHRAITAVIQRWGGVDVLINNAGVTQLGNFADTPPSLYRRVFDINIFGAIHCTQAALPSLKERRGAIVVLSSVAGLAPLYGRSGYSASKHALHGLFETLRCELDGSGVDVTMVCPGFTDTGIEQHALGSGARPTVGKAASPADVADAIYGGVVARRRLLVLSTVGKLSWLIIRFAPALYDRLMLRRMRAGGS